MQEVGMYLSITRKWNVFKRYKMDLSPTKGGNTPMSKRYELIFCCPKMEMPLWPPRGEHLPSVITFFDFLFLLNLLQTKACIMAKLMACLTLKLLCWALEPFKMSRISRLVTFIFVLMHQSRVITLLEMTCLCLFCILVLDLFLLDLGFPLLILATG